MVIDVRTSDYVGGVKDPHDWTRPRFNGVTVRLGRLESVLFKALYQAKKGTLLHRAELVELLYGNKTRSKCALDGIVLALRTKMPDLVQFEVVNKLEYGWRLDPRAVKQLY